MVEPVARSRRFINFNSSSRTIIGIQIAVSHFGYAMEDFPLDVFKLRVLLNTKVHDI